MQACLCYVSESCSVMSDSLRPHGLYSPWSSSTRIPVHGVLQPEYQSMEFFNQNSSPWSSSTRIPELVAVLFSRDLLNPELKPHRSPTLQAGSSPAESSGKPSPVKAAPHIWSAHPRHNIPLLSSSQGQVPGN